MTNLLTGGLGGGRVGGSIVGAGIGFLLFLGAFLLLFFNEGRAVRTAKGLEEGGKIVVHVDESAVKPENEGKLVHLTGMATSTEVLHDGDFPVSAAAIKLKRMVTMYQWQEQSKSGTNRGGADDKSNYTYSKDWSETWRDSQKFKNPEGHVNPPMAIEARTLVAKRVMVGAFTLSSGLVNQMQEFEPLEVAAATPEQSREAPAVKLEGGIYRGVDPGNPAVGDLKITFAVVKPEVVSVVGEQSGNGVGAYETASGVSLEMLRPGTLSGHDMFTAAARENENLTWALRVGGFLMMWFGMMLIAGPIRRLASFVPILGSVVGMALVFASGVIAVSLSLLTISIAWIFFRPLLGVGLLAGGLAIGFGIWKLMKSSSGKPVLAA